MQDVTAIKELRYAGKTYRPGEALSVSDKDARLLGRIGKVSVGRPVPQVTDLPVVEKPAVEEEDEVSRLRSEYQEQFGKRPFMGWSPGQLRERMGEYSRRDMRAED